MAQHFQNSKRAALSCVNDRRARAVPATRTGTVRGSLAVLRFRDSPDLQIQLRAPAEYTPCRNIDEVSLTLCCLDGLFGVLVNPSSAFAAEPSSFDVLHQKRRGTV